jgi:hypothetical protein
MSDVWTDDNYDDQQPQDNNTVKTLRALHDADKETIKELKSRLDALEADRKVNVVAESLKSAGMNPAVAKFYQGDADPAAVAAWIDENKSVFGAAPAPEAGGEPDPAPVPSPVSTPQQQQDYQRILDAGVDGVPPTHFNEALGALNAAKTREELQEVFRRFQ